MSMGDLNEQWRLIARPDEEASVEHFEVKQSDKPAPGENEVWLKISIFSFRLPCGSG